MNERIKLLAEQAGLETQPAKLKIYKNDDGTVTSGGWEYPLEKFAQLIVRECISMADDFECDVNQRGLVDRMKQHFGVEE